MTPSFPFAYTSTDPELRLKQLESFMASILEGIGEGVIVVNRDFSIKYANSGYCRQAKMTCGEIVGKRCHETSHHSEVPCHETGNGCECAVQQCLDTGSHHQAIHKHYDKSGNAIYIETNAYPLTDAAGNIYAAMETLHDVTETLRLEQRLDEALERYRKLYDHAPYMMHSLDKNGVIIMCNATEELALGYGPGELAGRLFTDLIEPENSDVFVEKRDTLLTSGFFEGELTLVAKDGRRIPVQLSSRAIRNEAGEFVMSDSVLHDISERRHLEAQLLHSQKMEAVGLLAGGIAHDFNNVLTTIVGFGHLALMQHGVERPIRDHLEHILAAADRASHLTHSLLAFSRKQIIDPKPVNLGDIVTRMQKLLSRILGEDIDLKIYLSAPGSAVFADTVQIEQVLMNLATNARDAMPHGGMLLIEMEPVELTEEYVRTHAFAKPGKYMLLSVTDTGLGMEESIRRKIFEPFFTTKDVGKGSGLGLSMVYGTMKQHNGYINVYSEPGKGTTFKLYLPLTDAKAEVSESKPEEPVVGGSETILLAEDEPTVRNLASLLLTAHGYTVIEAETGDEAVALFAAHRQDIHMVVLDVIMPKKNGKAAYDEMNVIRPGVKALFMSGYTPNLIHKKGILEEGREFISKPFSPGSFLIKIRKILDA